MRKQASAPLPTELDPCFLGEERRGKENEEASLSFFADWRIRIMYMY